MESGNFLFLEVNRQAFRRLFQRHTHPNESHILRFSELSQLANVIHIVPDLLSPFELKRYVVRVTGKNSPQESDLTLTFLQFEKLLRLVARSSFSVLPDSQQMGRLVEYMRPACVLHYQVDLVREAPGTKNRTGKSLTMQLEDLDLGLKASSAASTPRQSQFYTMKSRQLDAIISPRARGQPPQRPKLKLDLFLSPSQAPLSSLKASFLKFKSTSESLLQHKKPRLSLAERSFIRTVRYNSYAAVSHKQTFVLKLAFRLWKAQAS